ncbi:transporter substrate-binding domain-containing protein [Alteromonas ponticola]|uniref:Transporter substrate-binding domain-containing protein n=1 Tax=Alteromonas aquimaris TaxID=2998417 RepID=A0ABT3P385_9ALTE|nr:hypothetical protein [Alteromonas aquimaris]MCW8107219.1 transporter substrate-binding domain-containing protein [Alteromonas aquimaris]
MSVRFTNLLFCKFIAASLLWLMSNNVYSNTYLVGIQQLDYYPHYDLSRSGDKGIAWHILEQFSRQHNVSFAYIPLPPKRLQLELGKGTIDFAYPDNPRWQPKDEQPGRNKVFSQGLALGIYGTLVKKEKVGQKLRQFSRLAFPLGFTPVKWHELITQNGIETIETYDAMGALRAVARGRADGADVEYNVAAYLTSITPDNIHLVLDPELPFSAVQFSLSTFAYPELIEKFNQFLIAEKDQIEKIKARYRLKQSIEPRDYYTNEDNLVEHSAK